MARFQCLVPIEGTVPLTMCDELVDDYRGRAAGAAPEPADPRFAKACKVTVRRLAPPTTGVHQAYVDVSCEIFNALNFA